VLRDNPMKRIKRSIQRLPSEGQILPGFGTRFKVALRRGGRALLAAFFTLVLLTFIWFQATRWYREHLLAQREAEAKVETSLRGNSIAVALDRRFNLIEGLNAFVQSEATLEGIQERFPTYASGLFASTPGIRNIAIAPGGVVQFIYPLEGNEVVLGYQPSQDPQPEVRQDVQRAITTRQIILSRPVELVEGRLGVVARQAIFKEERYWGLINIALEITPIFQWSSPTLDLAVAVKDQYGDVFYGPEEIFDSDPILFPIALPDGSWELAAAPIEGWSSVIQDDLLGFQVTGILIVALLTSLVFVSTGHQTELQRAVSEATRELSRVNLELKEDIFARQHVEAELREREEQYRSIFESVSDGLLIYDVSGDLVDFNPAAYKMHGYTQDEFSQLQPVDFIHPDSMAFFKRYLRTIQGGKPVRGRAVDVHKDGSKFYVEVLGSEFAYRGEPHALTVMRDITSEVEAYQILEKRVEERTRELSTLLEVSRKVNATLELKPLISLILDQLNKVVDYRAATVYLLEEDKHEPVLLEKRGDADLSSYQDIFSDLNTFIAPLINEGKPLILENGSYGSKQARACMVIPLLVKDRLTGLVFLENDHPKSYLERHAELASAFANQASVAMENARLYVQAKELAALQERQKLARELHDSISQVLYSIGLGARTARMLLERDPLKASEPMDYVLELTEAGLAEMRALIFELRPESIEAEGLVAALTKQATAIKSRHQIEIDTNFCPEPELSVEQKQALFRVVQEALHNVVKHAQASHVDIKMTCSLDELTLEVKDNGVGFNPGSNFPGHLGLQSMHERIDRMGGEFHIDSEPGQGSTIHASVPLSN
jgi:PAS domain S-box-containing protein